MKSSNFITNMAAVVCDYLTQNLLFNPESTNAVIFSSSQAIAAIRREVVQIKSIWISNKQVDLGQLSKERSENVRS